MSRTTLKIGTSLARLAPVSDLVFLDDLQRNVFADSLKIAKEFGRAHKNVIQSIEALAANPEISRLTFQPRDYIGERGKPQKTYSMNRDGFMLLVMGFTGSKALKIKVNFVSAFNSMEAHIRTIERNRIEAQPARIESKGHRREFTDAVQHLAELSKAQKSLNGRFLYPHLTRHVYKALGLFSGTSVPDGFRDRLTAHELQDCAMVERVMSRRIDQLLALDDGKNYKAIRDAGCNAATRTAELLGAA